MKEWDRTAIKNALSTLDIQLEDPIIKVSVFEKIKNIFFR
jgi:hypothetical protein